MEPELDFAIIFFVAQTAIQIGLLVWLKRTQSKRPVSRITVIIVFVVSAPWWFLTIPFGFIISPKGPHGYTNPDKKMHPALKGTVALVGCVATMLLMAAIAHSIAIDGEHMREEDYAGVVLCIWLSILVMKEIANEYDDSVVDGDGFNILMNHQATGVFCLLAVIPMGVSALLSSALDPNAIVKFSVLLVFESIVVYIVWFFGREAIQIREKETIFMSLISIEYGVVMGVLGTHWIT